jgi:DNA-binding transcriptional ArsR family regulator
MAQEPSIPEIDSLLHEPARLRVLALLAIVEEADFMYILRQTGLSRGNLSVQMTKLEAANLVELDRNIEGTRVRTSYRLSAHGVNTLRLYKRSMLHLLSALPD